MNTSRILSVPLLALSLSPLLAGCGGHDVRVIRVPADARTVQEAVDSAADGDLVLVSPGVYREAVRITKPGITIRGSDRNRVILDGGDRLQNGVTATADRVAIENLTIRRYQSNGVLVTGAYGTAEGGGRPEGAEVPDVSSQKPVSGYRVAWVTAWDNGLYGIYAFVATKGLITHTYTSGHPDSGIYVGQCSPCDVRVERNVAERNAIGYFATNTSGGAVVEHNHFSRNRLGLALNSEDAERLAPGHGNVVRGNEIFGNAADSIAPEIEEGFPGGGIGVAGSIASRIESNLVRDNGPVGILLMPRGRYLPRRNAIAANVVEGHGIDLAYQSSGRSFLNCFQGNTFRSSMPGSIESAMPCPGTDRRVSAYLFRPSKGSAGPDYRSIPAPPAQPGMPGDITSLRTAGGV